MLRGIYASGSAMKMQGIQQEILADNLANINTSGYKTENISFRSFVPRVVRGDDDQVLGVMNNGVNVHTTNYNFEQGPLRITENPLDIAITGTGFFPVELPDGDIQYTRNGHFTIDREGFVTTLHGDKLLDEGLAPIVIDISSSKDITVTKDGTFLIDGQAMTRLSTFNFPQGAGIVRMTGDKYDLGDDNMTMNNGVVMIQSNADLFHQGFLEDSNVSAVKMSTEMIKTMRSYEANQKVMKSQVDTLRLIMDIGRI
ncbi:MAG: flagellar hook-basal body protein [Candidatus Caenarcaniphilales bacterium]|nr:flagellar hook-basal body protein [Candidatus Caenarcaniphilales bacterium]